MKKLTLTAGLAIAATSFLVVQAATPGNPFASTPFASTPLASTPLASTPLLPVSQSAPATDYNDNSQSMDGVIQLPAVVRPSMFVELPSLTPGIIQSVSVQEGMGVSKGEVLVQLDDRIFRARLATATIRANLTGALERARVEQRISMERLQRLQRVVSAGAGRSYEIQEAQGAIDQATAAIKQQQDVLDSAESERQLAEAQLVELTITAPFDGVITRVRQKAGAVDPTVVVIEMANLSLLEVELNVPSIRFGQLQVGQTVQLNADVPISSTLQGVVLSVSPIIDSASDTFRCLVQIENRDGKLPAGFRVKLR